MAEEDDSPQWLQDYKIPETVDLSSSPSREGDERSPVRAPARKRKRYMLSDTESEREEEMEEVSKKELEEEDDDKRKDVAETKKAGKEEEEQGEGEGDGDGNERKDVVEGHVDEGNGANGDEDAAPSKPEAVEKKVKNKMASSLPLVFPEKVSRSKILLECESDALDVSGDMGAVGRVSVSDKNDVLLDLKGTIYRTNIVPSNSFFLVNIGASEAKVEAIMNDFVQLIPDASNCNTETMIEGTLDGLTFDSEDEGVKPAPTAEVTGDEKKSARKGKAAKETKAPKKSSLPSKKAAIKKAVKRSGAKATGKKASKKSK